MNIRGMLTLLRDVSMAPGTQTPGVSIEHQRIETKYCRSWRQRCDTNETPGVFTEKIHNLGA